MKFIISCLVIFLLGSSNITSAMNLDSLRGALNQTSPDSTNLKSYLKVLARLEADENPARITICNWLIYQATRIKNFEIASKAYNEMGAIYIESGNKVLASEYLNRGLRVAEDHDLFHLQFRILNSLGSLYYEYNQIDLAITYFKKAINQGKKSSKTTGLGKAYYNLAGMYLDTGYESKDTLLQALNLCNYALRLSEKNSDTSGVISCLGGIASIYIDLGQLDSAIYYLDQKELLINASGTDEYLVTHYSDLGRVLFEQEKYRQAIDIYKSGLSYAIKFENPRWRSHYYENLAVSYEAVNDFRDANRYNILCRELNDSILSADNFETIHNLQIQYETEKKENEILKLSKDNEIKQLKIQKEQDTLLILKVIIVFGVVIVLSLILLAYFLIRLNRFRKRTNEELALKNIEIQKQGGVLSQQSKLIARYQSQMNPHFLFNALNTIQGSVINDNKLKTVDQLQLLSKLMRDTLNNSEQDFITLNDEIEYLKRYIQFEQSRFNNSIIFDVSLPDNAEEICIPPMLIQPFVENSIKHGALHLITEPIIHLKVILSAAALEVSISDNGCGFDSEKKSKTGHSHAIGILQTRLAVIWDASGGVNRPHPLFSVLSKPNLVSGTIVTFYLPLKFKY